MPSRCSVVRSRKELLPRSPPMTGCGQGCSNSRRLSGSMKETSVTESLSTRMSLTRRMAMAQRWWTTISSGGRLVLSAVFFETKSRSTESGGVGMVMVRFSLLKDIMRSMPFVGRPSSCLFFGRPSSCSFNGHICLCFWRGSPQMTLVCFSPIPRMTRGDSFVPLSSGRRNRGSFM